MWANGGQNVSLRVAMLGGMVVGARLGNVDLLAGGVVVPVLHARVGDARVGKDDTLSLFDELFRVCFKEGSILITVFRTDR
jgi:hypothetical protein